MDGERFELRDPFSETIHHAKRFDEMVAKAEKLGSNRFTAVDTQGRRTLVRQVDGEWTRGPLRSVEQPPGVHSAPARDSSAAPTPASTRPERPEKPTPEPEHRSGPAAKPRGPEPEPSKSDPAETRRIAQAERAARVAQLETALSERYVVKRAPAVADVSLGTSEYRFRGDTARVAFTASHLKLATETNSPSVARSMVDVAEARNWKTLRATGHEEFRRRVWFEASLRGVTAVGYEPMPSDLAWLRSEREARQLNRIEPARDASHSTAAAPVAKASARGGGGRKAVLAAIEAVLIAKHVPEKQREAVMAAATQKLAQRTRERATPKVKVYDSAAPSRRPSIAPSVEPQRSRERAGPSPAR